MYHGPAQEAIEYFGSIGKLLHGPLARYVKLWVVHAKGMLPLARYVRLRVAHAPGMPGTVSPPQRVSNPNMHMARVACTFPDACWDR